MRHELPVIQNVPAANAPDLFAISARVLSHQPLAVLAEDYNRNIRIVNRAFCRLFSISLSPEELTGTDCDKLRMNAKKLLKEENNFIEQIASILHNHVPVSDLEFELKDGRYLSVQYTPCFEDNILLGHIWCYTDVTASIKAKKQLIETLQKEKELNELKSSFVNMVSHEFRTPLAGISSSVELLELIDQQSDNPTKYRPALYHERIKGQVIRMTELMNDVLLLGKIENRKIEFKPSEVHLSGLCKEIINNNFNYAADPRKINITIRGREESMQIDTNLMRHILINLLTNALKYSNEGTDPELDLGFSKTHATIRVTDSGIGIPAKELKKLFSSFFRASNTGNIEGTGLGLVVVKYFVELHNGSIKVQSRINKGSVFTVTIPYK